MGVNKSFYKSAKQKVVDQKTLFRHSKSWGSLNLN